jgi:hypothetical protein
MGGTWFQCHIDGRSKALSRSQFPKGIDLGMWKSGGVMISFGKDPTVFHDHRPNGWIWSGATECPRGFPDRQTHEAFIGLLIGSLIHPVFRSFGEAGV